LFIGWTSKGLNELFLLDRLSGKETSEDLFPRDRLGPMEFFPWCNAVEMEEAGSGAACNVCSLRRADK
jgi:hypothetical protein